MSALNIIFTILQVLSGLAVTAIVLAQSGKSAGLSGSISGGADTFMSKGKAKTLDAKLAKLTKWFALAFVLLTLVLNLIVKPAAAAQETDETQSTISGEVLDQTEIDETQDADGE